VPGLHLNAEVVAGSEHAKTVPIGYDFEVPLSLHAETCISEFRPKPKTGGLNKPGSSGNVKNAAVANMVAEFNDNSDFLYNAYADAQKGKKIVKKIKRMKS